MTAQEIRVKSLCPRDYVAMLLAAEKISLGLDKKRDRERLRRLQSKHGVYIIDIGLKE